MLIHNGFGRPDILAFVHGYRGPLIGFGVAMALALTARMLRRPALAGAACGAGVVAGWFALGSTSFSWVPRLPADRLWVLAAAAVAGGLVVARLNSKAVLWPVIGCIALVLAWWVAGAPQSRGALLAGWPMGAGAAAGIMLVAFLMMAPAAEPIRIVAAALTLASAFHQVDAPRIWVQLALVIAAAALPLRLARAAGWIVLLPLALDLGGLATMAVADAGRLPRGGFRGMDAAALSPVLTLLLLPWLEKRLSGTGRAARVLAAIVAFCLAMAMLWIWLRVRGA